MRRFASGFLCIAVLLAASCGGKEPVAQYTPAIRAELVSVEKHQAFFKLDAVQASSIEYGAATSTPVPLEKRMETGTTGPARLSATIENLQPGTDYIFAARGIGPGGEEGSLITITFTTEAEAETLYSWETGRSTLPYPADMTLIPGPSSHRSPLGWSKDRWRSHVSYVDENGTEHWLFDSFLLIEGQQNGRYGDPVITYSVTDEDRPSATKADWQKLLDFWFTGGSFLWQETYWGDGVNTFGRWYTGRTETVSFPSGQLDALEACIDEVAARIGAPPSKRYIVMALPEPIYFDNYSLGVKGNGSSVYWGSLNGQALDFSKTEDRIKACKWFMDLTRKAFDRKGYRNIELLGFYILPEVLSTTWRAKYKQYDVVIPAVAEYAHSCNEALYWIPYCMAEGYTRWKEFGFDIAYMQPNYYWEPDKKPMDKTFSEINRYAMGLELEFEYSMVENVNGASSAALYRSRFDEYLSRAKSSGVYGNRSIALYSGTDALNQLATSPLEGDKATYHKLGHFIIESPLKQ